jgi:outer membrane protein assembly factor BamB
METESRNLKRQVRPNGARPHASLLGAFAFPSLRTTDIRLPVFPLPLLLTLLCATSLPAQDWPHWRGPGRDGKASGFVAPAAWPTELKQKWHSPVGLGDATPALVGERLYTFGRMEAEEVVLCLNASDGSKIWRYAYASVPVTGPAEKYAGPRSSPAVADGKVITLGVGGVLTCLDAASGKVAWRQEALTKALPRFFTSMSPLVTDGLCIAHLGGKDEGLLVALELGTGKVRWQWAGEGPAYASPVLLTMNGATQVVLQTEQSLTSLALADGKRLWQTPVSPKPGYWNSATPVVDGTTVYYSGQGTGTRAVRIEKQGDGFTARELWRNAEHGTVYNTPVLKHGRLFALSDRGQFFCLDTATGQTAWTSTNRVSNFGSIVDAGQVLVALPEKNGILFYQPSPDRYEVLAHFPVSDTPIYAHPVVAGNRLFVRDRDSVGMWLLPGA